MSVVFTSQKSNYPKVHLNANSYQIDSYMTITADLAYNPLRVALAAYGSVQNADLLWLINRIRNPWKELTLGRVIQVPSLQGASSKALVTSAAKTVKVKNVRVKGNKIVY